MKKKQTKVRKIIKECVIRGCMCGNTQRWTRGEAGCYLPLRLLGDQLIGWKSSTQRNESSTPKVPIPKLIHLIPTPKVNPAWHSIGRLNCTVRESFQRNLIWQSILLLVFACCPASLPLLARFLSIFTINTLIIWQGTSKKLLELAKLYLDDLNHRDMVVLTWAWTWSLHI